MMAEKEVETIRVVDKRTGRGPLLMNKSDFEGQKEQYEVYQDPGGVTMNNMPVGVDPLGRNTSGTYSEPTPSDIRFPDKDATEFENNHGAFVKKDAASMRDVAGMPDEPGGIVNEDLTPEQPDGGVGEEGPVSLVSKTKDKDGKETKNVVLENVSRADLKEYEALKGDRTKRLAWISQKRAAQPKTLPTPEEVEKSRGGSGKSARRQEEQQRRPGGAAPAQPTSPGATPPKP
jgi:hypothetical protein